MVKAPVSFAENVGFAFRTRCAECHIKDNKGGLSLATFAALMKGGENGPVVVPGKPDESKLVQLVEADKMPAEGDPLSEEFKTDIREWVEKGAKFDGPDKDAKLADYVFVPEDGGPQAGRGGRGDGGARRPRGNNWNPFTRFDKNEDKKLTKDEVEGRLKERFDEIDANKDGSITTEEFNARMEGRTRGDGSSAAPGSTEAQPKTAAEKPAKQ